MGKTEDEPMHDWESLSHVRWDCKYHVVFVPKYRQKKLYGKFRRKVGEIFSAFMPPAWSRTHGRAFKA